MTRKKLTAVPPKQPKKITEAGLPEELETLLGCPDDVANSLNEMFRQGDCIKSQMEFFALVDKSAQEGFALYHRSGFKGIASHFKKLAEDARSLVREIERQKVHGRLKFHQEHQSQGEEYNQAAIDEHAKAEAEAATARGEDTEEEPENNEEE